MEAYLRKEKEDLMDDMKQSWIPVNGGVEDQFGFIILVKDGYRLFYKNDFVITVFSLPAAKLISRIILNDRIANHRTIACETTVAFKYGQQNGNDNGF